MRTPICVVSADWHLERNAWVRHPDLAGDSYYGLEQVVDLALLMKLPLIAAGDLFNKPYPDAKSVYVAMQQMDRMQEAELPVYYVQGQHERTKDQPWLGLHPWPFHLHKQVVTIGPHRFVGLDYTRPDDLITGLAQACQQAPGGILVAHQVWKEFMGVGHTDASLTQVPAVSVVLTGDFHKHTHLRLRGADGQKLLILSPGSLCLQTTDEPSAKAVYILYSDFTFETIPIKSRVISHYEIQSKEDLYQLMATVEYGALEQQTGVPDNIAKPIVCIRYNPDIEDAYVNLVDLIGNRAHLFIKPVTNQVLNITSEIPKDEAQEVIDAGLEGNLIKHCPADSLTYAIARRLLQASNVKEELAAIEEEYLEGV